MDIRKLFISTGVAGETVGEFDRHYKAMLAQMNTPVYSERAVAVAELKELPREKVFPPAPEPSSADVTPVDVDREVLSEHARLAAKLGVHSNADRELKAAEFKTFLRESGFRVYDEKHVGAYLTSQYGVEKQERGETIPTWGWRPLRQADAAAVADTQFQMAMMMQRSSANAGPNGRVQRGASVYAKPVPIPVLLTVEKVVEKFPDVKLYVSDEFHPREFVKDPFLLVVHQGKHYIIERWDEPNYRER